MPMKCLKQYGHGADLLIEETRRHIIDSLPVGKQTSNYLSGFLWETQPPTTQGEDAGEFAGGAASFWGNSLMCFSTNAHFISLGGKLYVFVQVCVPLATWLLFKIMNIKYGTLKGILEDWMVVVIGWYVGRQLWTSGRSVMWWLPAGSFSGFQH